MARKKKEVDVTFDEAPDETSNETIKNITEETKAAYRQMPADILTSEEIDFLLHTTEDEDQTTLINILSDSLDQAPELMCLGESDSPYKMSFELTTAQSDESGVYMADMTTSPQVGVYSLSDTAEIPEYATNHSACFDLKADFSGVDSVVIYNSKNQRIDRAVRGSDQSQQVALDPGDRAMIPTNLIFDIPVGFKMLIYPRSGNSLKRGLQLANSVGVVDADFNHPAMVLIYNASRDGLHIQHGERVAQAEVVPTLTAVFSKLDQKPSNKDGLKKNRTGGFGSTGG